MGRVTRWNAHGYEVTDLPEQWHETDVEAMDTGTSGWGIGIRRVGSTRWEWRWGTVPEVVRWWFIGGTQER